jgi:hypothetical protein
MVETMDKSTVEHLVVQTVSSMVEWRVGSKAYHLAGKLDDVRVAWRGYRTVGMTELQLAGQLVSAKVAELVVQTADLMTDVKAARMAGYWVDHLKVG